MFDNQEDDNTVYCKECTACGVHGCCPMNSCHYLDQYQGNYDELAQKNQRLEEALQAISQGTAAMAQFVEDKDMVDEEELANTLTNVTLIKTITAWAFTPPENS